MVTKLYIVRHCQSMGNIGGRFQGRFDAAVSPQGEKQLALLALRFRNVPLDAIYTSPLTRARRTAEAIGQYHRIEIQDEPGLTEIDVGEMENLALQEIGEKFPDVAKAWDQTPDLCRFPGGESMEQVYARVNGAVDRILAASRGRTVAVATHGGAIRNLVARVTYGGLEGIRHSEVFGNTGVSLLEEEDGALRWVFLNDMSHLPEELRRPPVDFHFGGAAPV